MLYNIEEKGILDIGAKDTITIGDIATHFNLNVSFGNRKEFQFTEKPKDNFPEAKEVLTFVQQIIENKK
jgi:hypothetical protein